MKRLFLHACDRNRDSKTVIDGMKLPWKNLVAGEHNSREVTPDALTYMMFLVQKRGWCKYSRLWVFPSNGTSLRPFPMNGGNPLKPILFSCNNTMTACKDEFNVALPHWRYENERNYAMPAGMVFDASLASWLESDCLFNLSDGFHRLLVSSEHVEGCFC